METTIEQPIIKQTIGQTCSGLTDALWEKLSPAEHDYWQDRGQAVLDSINNEQSELFKKLIEDNDDLNEIFNLHHAAQMRGYKMWLEAHPEKKMSMPSTDDLICWLLGEYDRLHTALDRIANEEGVSNVQSAPYKNPRDIAMEALSPHPETEVHVRSK